MNEQPTRDRSDTADAFIGFGLVILTVGLGLVSVALAVIVLGALLTLIGMASALRKGG